MSATVFVVNCGSSSVKYSLIDVDAGRAIASGLAERIGGESRLKHQGPNEDSVYEQRLPDHLSALRAVRQAFEHSGPREAEAGLVALAHRVVHGGDRFAGPVVIDDGVLRAIRELSSLAPLHNPANADGIEIAREAFPDVPHIAVFDTAFHHTLPPRAYTYAVPLEWGRSFGVRRYGFHGTSHAFVSRTAAGLLGRSLAETNTIVLHLGNGASVAAIQAGRSIDTSMGLTPLEGLVMGTRAGDVDAGVTFHLMRIAGLDVDGIDAALNRRSGMLALAGTNDLRDVEARAAGGDADAEVALDVYCYRIRKYVGAYYAALGRVDAIVFTAGVGENQSLVRARSLSGLERLGIVVDPELNAATSGEARFVSPEGAEVAVMVVPTDEELEMARQATGVLAAVSG